MKRAYELDVYKPAEELSDMVWQDFDMWNKADSDIDLIVVTNDNLFPKSYKEKSDLYLKVSSAMNDITRKIPIDLIVYIKPMYFKFNELGSLFSKEISQKGIVLYEADN